MRRKKLVWTILLTLPLAIGGFVYAGVASQKAGFICPATGEELPCPACCPLNAEE